MPTRALLALGLIVSTWSIVHAQDGLRSASLPERPIATRPPGPDDLFRARPETYRPRPDTYRPHAGRHDGARPPIVYGDGPWWPGPLLSALPSDEPRRSAELPGTTGALQLQLEPADASVYVDGSYIGRVADLRPPGAPLAAGTHRIVLRAPGYEPRTFDVRIAAGETRTYRESLRPESPPLPAAAPAAVSPAPQTLYVVPGCYAGSRPPAAATNCDLTRLRVIR